MAFAGLSLRLPGPEPHGIKSSSKLQACVLQWRTGQSHELCNASFCLRRFFPRRFGEAAANRRPAKEVLAIICWGAGLIFAWTPSSVFSWGIERTRAMVLTNRRVADQLSESEKRTAGPFGSRAESSLVARTVATNSDRSSIMP
jgi:hypothetical protein